MVGVLRFVDAPKVTMIYCDYKEKYGKKLDRNPKKRKDNFRNSMAQFERQGLIEFAGSGNEFKKEFLMYEIKDDELWSSLIQSASHGGYSDTSGLGTSQSDDSSQNEREATDSNTFTCDNCHQSISVRQRNEHTNNCPGGSSRGLYRQCAAKNRPEPNSSETSDCWRDIIEESASSSGEMVCELSSDAKPDECDDKTIEQIISGGTEESDCIGLVELFDKTFHDPKEINPVPLELKITPDVGPVEGGSIFKIHANEELPNVEFIVKFEDYGERKASKCDTRHMQGVGTIPKAIKRGDHTIKVTVSRVDNMTEIGSCLFKYTDSEQSMCLHAITIRHKRPSDRQDSHDPTDRSTKRPSSDSGNNTFRSKIRKCPIDTPMLMSLCEEMAKRGDKPFFWALNKLGILADVLANRSEYYNSFAATTRDHGHSELADFIVMYMSSREISCKCLVETLTLGKLVDAVGRERSLEKPIYCSDDDSDSSLGGYNGDYESEDDEFSFESGCEDVDSCSFIIHEGLQRWFHRSISMPVKDDSLEWEKSYEIFELGMKARYEILEHEPVAKEKDVTKRVPSEKNVPMMCAQVENTGVETSSSINVVRGLDDMDTQTVKTAVVKTTSVATSVEQSKNSKIGRVCDLPGTGAPKSAHIQDLYKPGDDLSSNTGSDDDEPRIPTIAQEYNFCCALPYFRTKLRGSWTKLGRTILDDSQTELHEIILKEQKRERKLEKKRERKLGRFKSRGCRWKVILNSSKSSCGKSVVDFTRKRKMSTSNSSDLNFKGPTIMKQSLTSMENVLVFNEKLHRQEKWHRFHNITNPYRMCTENRFHELVVIGSLDERTVDEKCDMVERITRIPLINFPGALVRFSEKQQFAESSQTARHAVKFGNAIADLGLEKRLAKSMSSSVADVHFTLEAKPFSNETDPGDEVQLTGAKGVIWIAVDLARIGDEVIATKVQFVSEAISENDSENTERTKITATANTKNEHDEKI